MKRSFKYSKIDAFTAGDSLGNPAACLYLPEGSSLSGSQMLNIARQHKGFVSEVIYCAYGGSGIMLTYYSSECEVDFCGHGTIACMYQMIANNPALLAQEEITIGTSRKGMLTVYNRIREQDAVFITAPGPRYGSPAISREVIEQNLGTGTGTVSREYPVECIDAGLKTLIVPIDSLKTEVSVYPDEQQLKQFCLEHDLDIILIFSKETEHSDYIAHTRVFAPKFGYLEDPATGSGNSAFGYYMLKNKMWDGSDCCIEQGGNNRIYNDIRLSCRNGNVLFGGSATLRIEGVYYV